MIITDHRRWSIDSRHLYHTILAPLVLAWLSGCASVQASGPIPHMTSILADDIQCRTSSNNLVADMPGMAGAFIVLEIDNNRVDVTSTNGGVLVHEGAATKVSNGTHGFNFVTDPIPPGSHQAKMRWAHNALTGSGTICVAERSMVIHHVQRWDDVAAAAGDRPRSP